MQIVLDGRYKAEKSVVALGMFDGVHIGHQVLLRKARALADECHAPLIACTFAQHPLTLISPDKAPALLTTAEERSVLMEGLGVDVLYAQPFDEALMHMPPENYVGELVRRFHPTAVVCGYNHTFGQNGAGTPALLSVLGGALGFDTIAVPQITLDGQEISSTAIRAALCGGDVHLAWRLLGRPYDQQICRTKQGGPRCLMTFAHDGKQPLPKGTYRALADDGMRRLPVVAHVDADGKAWCLLPSQAAAPQRLHCLTMLELCF